jgi:hypothetical protein
MERSGDAASDAVAPKTKPSDLVGNQFFLVGVIVGSAAGLVLGSALGFELRPENVRAIRKFLRHLTGQDDHPHYESMV